MGWSIREMWRRWREHRTHPKDASLADWWGIRATASGAKVNETTALNLAAVYSAVRIIAEGVASLPLNVYRRLEDGGKERATDHRLYWLLHDAPNPEMTAMEFRETIQAHVLLWGNAYSEVVRDGAGRVIELWPLRPDRVTVRRLAGELVYIVTVDGRQVPMPDDRVLHLRGLSSDGIMGYSPIRLAREPIGLAMAAEEYGARLFGSGSTPGGIIRHPGTLGDVAAQRLKADWEAKHRGLENAHRVAVLEEGMEWVKIGIDPKDAQFLELRLFQLREIARIFRIPPHMLGDLQAASYASVEQQSLDFVTQTLRPWLVRWEQAINTRLFSVEQQGTYYAEHVVEGLLRGDLASRYAAYAVGRQWGWLSVDEIRERENLNPLPRGRGTGYLVPLNMMTTGAQPTIDANGATGGSADGEEEAPPATDG